MVSWVSQKKFELNRSSPTNQSGSLLFWTFYLLKVGLGAIFEVFPCWRSNNGSKAFSKSSHIQILEIWSWNQNFPPGSLEDRYVPEMKIFKVLPSRSSNDGFFSPHKPIKCQGSGPPYFIQHQGSSRGPPEIHPEQEDHLNLDQKNDMIEVCLTKVLQNTSGMHKFCCF